MRQELGLVIVFSLVLGVAGTQAPFVLAQGQASKTGSESQAAGKDHSQDRDSNAKAGPLGDDFVMGAGDVLNIFVWKEAEVSKTVPVRPDGKISLPLVNDVQASGLTAMQLKAELEQRFSKFFADPVVTVTVEAVNSQKVTVMGEVAQAGPKPLEGPTRVMDIIAGAGLTPFSKATKIYILRNENGKQTRFDFNYKNYLKGKNAEQNILLKSGDTIVVP